MGFFTRFSKTVPELSVTTPATVTRTCRVTAEEAVAFGDLSLIDLSEVGIDAMDGLTCIPVVGESFCQDELVRLRDAFDALGRDGRGFVATLRPEPDNPHDANAVLVLLDPNGQKLGYLPRDVAHDFSKLVASLEPPVQCGARLVGGTTENPLIGVVLNFTNLKKLREAPGVRVVDEHGRRKG